MKNELMQLGITAKASIPDAGIHKNILVLRRTAFIISNEEMEDITKIVNSLGDNCLLIKAVTQTTENETKEQKDRFTVMLSTLGATLLRNMPAGKRRKATSKRRGLLMK